MRLIEPADAERLQRFVRGLSDETTHQRFFATVHELSPKQLARFTDNSDPFEFAVVAIAGNSPETAIVGTARCLKTDQNAEVEFAITIADAWQNAGLGAALFAELLAQARERAIRRITGETLRDNERMLSLARQHGFSVHTDPLDATLSRLRIDL